MNIDELDSVKATLKAQPNLGEGDESKCLPGWVAILAKKWEAKEGYKLSHQEVGAVLHTLIAARQRARRLVKERDESIATAHKAVLAQADGELSAIAHGRPPSSKEELLRMSDELRRLYEKRR